MILSIGMIVRDEGRNLAACLDGIKPILERVDSELIIADTGSSDDTVSIAQKYTKNVYAVEWRNDFAWARNTTLERAKGLWYMFLDADEIFKDVSDIIEFFDSGEYKNFRSASHLLEDAATKARDVFTRLYRIEKGTAFQGRIHEQIPLQPPVRHLNSLSVHSGYVFDGTDGEDGALKKAAKHRRNLPPLLEEQRERPHDLRITALIVNEFLSADDLEQARTYIDKGISQRVNTENDVFYHVLRYYDLLCLARGGLHKETAERARDYFAKAKKLFTCAVHMRMLEGNALEHLNNRLQAARAYDGAIKLFDGGTDDEDVLMSVTAKLPPTIKIFAAGSSAWNYAAAGSFGLCAERIREHNLNTAEILEQLREKNASRAKEYKNYLLDAEREAAQARLDSETGAIKDVVFGFIENNEIRQARNLLEQYAAANPADKDIGRYRRAIEKAEKAEKDKKTEKAETPETPETSKSLADKIKLMNGARTILLLSNIVPGGTGVINSALRKARILEDSFVMSPVILTCEHNIELRRILSALRAADGAAGNTAGNAAGGGVINIGQGTTIINVYDFFQNSYAEGLSDRRLYKNPSIFEQYAETDDKEIFDVFENGVLVRREYYTGAGGALRAVMYFEGGKKTRFFFYDDFGYLNKVCNFDEDENLPIVDFYNTEGIIRIRAFNDKNNELEKMVVYGDDGGAVFECADDAGLTALCLDLMLDDDAPCVLVIEDALLTRDIELLQHKNAAKVIVVHSIVLQDPYDPKSEPIGPYRYLCENPETFDGIVFLTNAARDDFCKKYGHTERAFVIPHPYENNAERADFSGRDAKKAVIVARFDAVKQIGLAIDIFAMAVKRMPDIKLEIYGFGSETEKDKCRRQIRRLNLEKNVFIMGATGDPAAVFRSAALSMMTSAFEGYPLTLIESICNGCPAIAFDIKYGTPDIIKHGETGFLVPRFDAKKYAEYLINFFTNPEQQKTMSQNAQNAAPLFSIDAFIKNWYHLYERLRIKD